MDRLRVHAGLTVAQYERPLITLLLLCFAEVKSSAVRAKLALAADKSLADCPGAYKAEGAYYFPPNTRTEQLLAMPPDLSLAKAVDAALRSMKKQNPDLTGFVPRTFKSFDPALLRDLLKLLSGTAGKPGVKYHHVAEWLMGNTGFAIQSDTKTRHAGLAQGNR
ncbi:MAG: hypothetical protein A2V88_04755 [Elusimicrobia bacterium RBG_16_66_12]|nr:MAG: hypothetical protein A2V88_04755 [Elusimicrobia bacterium RBG_16_66_12]